MWLCGLFIHSDSMNTELMFSSKSNEWSTPQSYFDSVKLEFWEFDLDPAADETNHKADRFFTISDDWLAQSWFWKVWCNPPYGRDLRKWVKKCFDESRGGGACILICLLIPARTDTSYFHDFIYNKPGVEIRFIRGRLKFGDSKNAAPFPSMLVIFK